MDLDQVFEYLKDNLMLDEYQDWDGEKGVILSLINPRSGEVVQLGYKVTTEKSDYDG
jgi:hypothetical protein